MALKLRRLNALPAYLKMAVENLSKLWDRNSVVMGWFGLVKCKNIGWIRRCTTIEIRGI